MFDGGFSEGGAGKKTIRIKDVSQNAFSMLLRFLYTGNLPEGAKPKTVYTDPLNKHTDASWESLYILAHRYDIQELVDPASYRNLIQKELCRSYSVPRIFSRISVTQ